MPAPSTILRWFSGGDAQYHDLVHCLRHDQPTIAAVVILCCGVMAGYLIFARQCWRDAKSLPIGDAKKSLAWLCNIFLLCCFCGYTFIVIKIIWPAWRLEALALAALNYFTWRFVLNGGLRSVYAELSSADKTRELERHFHQFFDCLPQLAWIADADGAIVSYNRRWYEYTGKSVSDMTSWGWQSVHDPAILPEVLDKWRAALASGNPFEMEFPLRRKDGVYRWFLTRAYPVRLAVGGEVQYWFGSNTDVDHRRRNEQQLSASFERLKQITEAMNAKDAGKVNGGA